MELLLDRTNYLNWFFDWLFVCQNCKRWAAAFLQFFVMRKRNCHVNTGPLRFADGKYRRATVVTPALRKKWSAAARANLKTNLGSREEYLVAISGVGDLLLCLRNGWNRYLRFPILQVQQCFGRFKNMDRSLMILYSKGISLKIAITLVNSICN